MYDSAKASSFRVGTRFPRTAGHSSRWSHASTLQALNGSTY
jgi:hypothetical protein